jgi:cytochrome c
MGTAFGAFHFEGRKIYTDRRTKMARIVRVVFGIVVVVAFAGSAFAYTADQAAKGKDLYVKYCAVCHGASGGGGAVPEQFGKLAGMKVPPLVGPGFLPGMKDVGQVYAFAKKNMPGNKPGSLKSSEYLAIVSFALQANGIEPDEKPLTPTSAKAIKLSGGK